jgi:hypothetical protein
MDQPFMDFGDVRSDIGFDHDKSVGLQLLQRFPNRDLADTQLIRQNASKVLSNLKFR